MTKSFGTGKKILCIILAILLVVNICVIAAESQEGIGILSNLPFSFVPVTGTSMEPEYGDGDAVFAVQIPYSELKVGDDVIYAYGNELVVHELIAFDADGMITKGIANALDDGVISESQYRAKVLFRIPGLGAIWRISSNPLSFAFLAILIVIIVFGKDIFSTIYNLVFKEKQ